MVTFVEPCWFGGVGRPFFVAVPGGGKGGFVLKFPAVTLATVIWPLLSMANAPPVLPPVIEYVCVCPVMSGSVNVIGVPTFVPFAVFSASVNGPAALTTGASLMLLTLIVIVAV